MPPPKRSEKGRFYHLINQGLEKHPYAIAVKGIAEADCVVWLTNSIGTPPRDQLSIPTGEGAVSRVGKGGNKLMAGGGSAAASRKVIIVLDEGDAPMPFQGASKIPYTVYFKRSWVWKLNGHYAGYQNRWRRAYFPMLYSASDAYHESVFESLQERYRDVVCTLRCIAPQPARCRVKRWLRAMVKDLGLKNTILTEVNAGSRRELSRHYFAAMRTARIVVTCNPSAWEGDFRLFEAMMSGALVFVDEMWGPQPFPLRHGKHVMVYDNSNRSDFTSKVAYYLAHPAEARRIARNGYLHVLKYHRAVSRFDWFLRTAHHQDVNGSGGAAPPQYREIGHHIKGDITKAMILGSKPANWIRL